MPKPRAGRTVSLVAAGHALTEIAPPRRPRAMRPSGAKAVYADAFAHRLAG